MTRRRGGASVEVIDDRSPVSADEDVLRRVVMRSSYFNPTLPISIQRYAFQPMPDDSQGISVYRKRFISPENLAAAGSSTEGYVVAALGVQAIHDIDCGATRMSVKADHMDDVPGHALIPELNFELRQTNKHLAKEMQQRLAELASKRIVYMPDSPEPG